jgi:hypothetical protein
MDVFEVLEKEVPQYGKLSVDFIDDNGEKRRYRIAHANGGGLLVMYPRSKRYGYRLDQRFLHNFIAFDIKNKKDRLSEEKRWSKSWEKVLSYLTKSGLWKDVASDVSIALSVGYEKIKQADSQYWEHYPDVDYQEQGRLNAEKIKAIDERLVTYNKDGIPHANTSIIWYMSKIAKIKSMYFGKYYNHAEKKATLKKAMETKTSISLWGRASYDVSLEYNAEANKAWYSEEYKNCGNGHYYLALDDTHALFYEDD